MATYAGHSLDGPLHREQSAPFPRLLHHLELIPPSAEVWHELREYASFEANRGILLMQAQELVVDLEKQLGDALERMRIVATKAAAYDTTMMKLRQAQEQISVLQNQLKYSQDTLRTVSSKIDVYEKEHTRLAVQDLQIQREHDWSKLGATSMEIGPPIPPPRPSLVSTSLNRSVGVSREVSHHANKGGLQTIRLRRHASDPSQPDKAGVGMMLERHSDGTVLVGDVQIDSPAWNSGKVSTGDRLHFVDGKATDGLSMKEVCGSIQGADGTYVELVFSSELPIQKSAEYHGNMSEEVVFDSPSPALASKGNQREYILWRECMDLRERLAQKDEGKWKLMADIDRLRSTLEEKNNGEKLLWEKNRNLENEIKVLSQQLRSQSSSPFGILSSPSPVSHPHLETSIAKTTQQVSTPTEMSHGVPGRTTCFQCGLVAENNLCCGRCFNAIYCSRKCQEKHWKAGHKNTCDMKLASFKDSFEGHALQDELSQRTKVK